MAEQLVETMSGLLVPESALPPPPSNTDLSGTFDSREEAEKWVSKCIVRWHWAIRTTLLDEDKPEDWDSYKVTAYRSGGEMHDTTMESYAEITEDRALVSYVEIIKENTADEKRPIVYRVVNKL